jgi:tRNA nucleotidyltransferase (CCA-adding enzyme)
MKTYVVGGAVRDTLLGRPVHDRDHVVVGQSPEALLRAGFTQVGRDFPVFLHPQTHEEYALARTERKTGPGYRGFECHASPDVTLEEDLGRRDLTINAMAMDEEGHLIDPFGGQKDLQEKVLRHVGPAFVEDPLRVLRLARFAARFPDFTVAPETQALALALVKSNELAHLASERVWQELARGLMTERPDRMITVLQACGAWAYVLPELHPLPAKAQAALMRAADGHAALEVRVAALFSSLWETEGPAALPVVTQRLDHLKAPAACRDLAVQMGHLHSHWDALWGREGGTPENTLAFLMACDAFRRPARYEAIVACFFYAHPREEANPRDWRFARFLQTALEAAQQVDAGAIARAQTSPSAIPGAIHAARLAAITAAPCAEKALA